MKQEKFFEILALTTAISSHISIVYLYIKQIHNHNFLIRNAIALFLLTIVNVILLLAYSHSRYNIYQLFDLGRNSEFKSIIKIANYSRCKQELKAIRVRNHVDRDFASQSTTDLFPKVRFQKVLNKKVNKEDRIYKIMLYCFILSFFLLFVAESWAILQCFINVHNDLSYYYQDVSKINRVILIMTMFATVPALLLPYTFA